MAFIAQCSSAAVVCLVIGLLFLIDARDIRLGRPPLITIIRAGSPARARLYGGLLAATGLVGIGLCIGYLANKSVEGITKRRTRALAAKYPDLDAEALNKLADA